MGSFERNLTWWVFGCIAAGIALGRAFPAFFQVVGNLKLAEVNLPVAALVWLMIVPMLLKVDFGALHEVKRHSRGIGVTLFINWAVKPFSMALLAWLFVRHALRALAAGRPARQLRRRPDPARRGAVHGDGLRVEQPVGRRSELHADAGGAERHDHAVRIRPLVATAAGPLGHRRAMGRRSPRPSCSTSSCRSSSPNRGGEACCAAATDRRSPGVLARLHPVSLSALLLTLVLLFGFQGRQILDQPWSSRCWPCRS